MGLLSQVQNVVAGMSSDEIKALQEWVRKQQDEAALDPLNHGFRPHPGQLAVHSSLAQQLMLVAANRFGKSTAGIRETLWRATGTHPYKKIKPHRTIWCGFPDYPFFLRTTLPLFRKWVPRNRLIDFNKSEKWATFQNDDGGVTEVFFLSYDMGREKWQGAAVDFIWLDEEVPEDIFEEAYARLIDSGGEILKTLTPVSGLGWAYDAIYLPWQNRRSNWEVIEGALAEYRPECVCGHQPEQHVQHKVTGRRVCLACDCQDFSQMFEFAVGRSLVPHLSREQILRFARSIRDPDMRLIRIFGKFRARAGGVYKQFNPSVHVIPAFKIPSYYEVWGGIDPGFHGFAVVLLAQDPMGRVFVFHEYFSQHETTGDRARELWSRVQELVNLPDDEYLVLYVDTEDPQTVMELNTWAQENDTRMVFASLDQGLKARKAGISRIQEYLSPDQKRATPLVVMRDRPSQGEPLLYLFDTLNSTWITGEESMMTSRLVWELTRYLWKKKQKEGARQEDADEASAGGAHMLAALRYAMMARLGPPSSPEVDRYEDAPTSLDREVRQHLDELHEQRMAVVKGVGEEWS